MTPDTSEPRCGSASTRGVVLSGTGGVWRIRTDGGESLDASLRGRLKNRAATRPSEARRPKLAVGDRVGVEPGRHGGWAIAEILPRTSKLSRRAPVGAFGERILAANVDQVIVVVAAAHPEPNSRMLDRFLIIAEANELGARIVVNKVDLADEAETHRWCEPYERAGYPVHYASVKLGRGVDAIRAVLDNRISVLTGPSGVGKSSMINAIFPGLNLRVGAISESVQKGRHTTVGSVMVPLPAPGGGYVVDTPGLREVGIWDLPAGALDRCFPEFRPQLGLCRFGDCRHSLEPGCAVLDAVRRGDLSVARFESYTLLLDQLVSG
ncbi:MAG TPA: ribosome small subunit-dependent GTPase A, partial [Gemmatimonadaceae bacterium]|nr:ribosome small subunit-dependent GTPase A [Gemmatimonadaceae bacterium]